MNVSTGRFVKGQERLTGKLGAMGEYYLVWPDNYPQGSPSEEQVPRAFKAFALKEAAGNGYTSLIWADASIVPANSLQSAWEQIERDGYLIIQNGNYKNYEWTADSAYKTLFPDILWDQEARALNRTIPHVVSGVFGVDLTKQIGRDILDQFYQLACTRAFCGPVVNSRSGVPKSGYSWAPCGPPDVSGHRHDQTALSVVAWRLGCQLTADPDIFSYKIGANERTIFVADGAY